MEKNFILLALLALSACETPQNMSDAPAGFKDSSEAQLSFNRATNNGTKIPSAEKLNAEINGAHSLSATVNTPPCMSCAKPATTKSSHYNINESQRRKLVEKIIQNGLNKQATTTLKLPGGTFDVMNDAPTLPDGTYVNFTYAEAHEIADKWGCKLPNVAQARAIRSYAESKGHIFNARTHLPNDTPQRYTNMNKMMNDPRMHQRAKEGKDHLINGHFKWYIDDGSNHFRFFGFRVPGACSRNYCQNGGSGGHGDSWIDYSQSVRLICPHKI